MNKTIESCFNHVGLKFDANEIDRAHRLGKPYKDRITKASVQPIIIKFKSWSSRTAFYKARPKTFTNGNRNQNVPFSCNLDLTKRRYNLLKDVRGIVKHYPQINYAFADINCSLGICLHSNELKYFNDRARLDEILGNLDFVEIEE